MVLVCRQKDIFKLIDNRDLSFTVARFLESHPGLFFLSIFPLDCISLQLDTIMAWNSARELVVSLSGLSNADCLLIAEIPYPTIHLKRLVWGQGLRLWQAGSVEDMG